MPIIQIKMWKGRSAQEKKTLIKSITDSTVDSIGCPAEAVQVVIEEHDKEDWGIAGEQASEAYPD